MSNICKLLEAQNIINFCIHNTDVTTNNKSIIWYKHVIHVCRVKYNQVSKSRNDDI